MLIDLSGRQTDGDIFSLWVIPFEILLEGPGGGETKNRNAQGGGLGQKDITHVLPVCHKFIDPFLTFEDLIDVTQDLKWNSPNSYYALQSCFNMTSCHYQWSSWSLHEKW